MRIHLPEWFAACLFLATVSVATAQPSESSPPSMEQAIRNNSLMLQNVHANPQAKAQALARMKEAMTRRGVIDSDSRLAEIGKIIDEAASMSDADFEKSRQQLAVRIADQMRPSGGVPLSGGGVSATTAGAEGSASRDHGSAVAPTAGTIHWIDVHNHLIPGQRRDFSGSFSAALAVMDQVGISTMIVMPQPQCSAGYDCDSFTAALRQYSTRFAFLGGGGSLNAMIQQAGGDRTVSEKLRQQFKQKADEIIGQGASGFGEMAIHHLSLHGEDHPYESVPADHPLLLLLADIAAMHDVPIDVHLDVVTKDIPTPAWLSDSPNNPKVLHANLAPFERLLDHNPKTRICWAHAGSDNTGQWTVDLSRELLQKHPNLYMSLRLGPGHAPENFPLTRGGQIKPEWLSLLKDFPDRFLVGSDNFIASASFRGSGTAALLANRIPLTREFTPVFLKALPPDLAHKISFENAMSLYRLKR